MAKVSYFKSFTDKAHTVELSDILNAIKNGAFKESIEYLRSLHKDEYDVAKKKLPHFTATGVFGAARKLEFLQEYNSHIVLDIDHIGFEKAKRLKEVLVLFSHCLAAFLSPGGDGVKILVLTDSTRDTHAAVFNQIADFYEEHLGVAIDRSGIDINRCCFVSWDPDLYLNESPVIFKSTPVEPQSIAPLPERKMFVPHDLNDPYDDKSIFEEMVRFTERLEEYHRGNRNNFIYKLANNLNRRGIDVFTAERMIRERYNDLPLKEIVHTVRSAYRNWTEHNMYGYQKYIA
jgi:hypothetical protein